MSLKLPFLDFTFICSLSHRFSEKVEGSGDPEEELSSEMQVACPRPHREIVRRLLPRLAWPWALAPTSLSGLPGPAACLSQVLVPGFVPGAVAELCSVRWLA